MENFVLPEAWHVVVTEENKEVLSKWRGDKLIVGQITGMCKDFEDGTIEKEHNPPGSIKCSSYTFGEEITFEQFKKNCLKLIGYRLIKTEYALAACKIEGFKTFGTDIENGNEILFEDTVGREEGFEKLREAGVLDIWFEPVYEEMMNILPLICGYKGSIRDNRIIYGCHEYEISYVRDLYKLMNKSFKSIKSNDNYEITFEEIKQIIAYLDQEKL